MSLEWHEASAEAMPLPDEVFDVALCQLRIQFIPDKLAGLKEIWRILVPGGRLLLNVPGPVGKLFAVFAEAMERNISSDAAGFTNQVFSLHDPAERHQLMSEDGFRGIVLEANDKMLNLPPSTVFLWQYIYSTAVAAVVRKRTNKIWPPWSAKSSKCGGNLRKMAT